jgi:signal transduction histidine kinase
VRFAPALFLAAFFADGLNGGFPVGLVPTMVMDGLIAAGYAIVAALLRRFVTSGVGLQSPRGTSWFLAIVSVGTLAIAAAVAATLILMRALPPTQFVTAARHLWVGDLSGIVAFLPALMTLPMAWKRWQETPTRARIVDPGVFAFTLGAALWIVFGVGGENGFRFSYFLLLPMIWVGARHGFPWCAIAVLFEQVVLITTVTLYGFPLAWATDFQTLALAISATGLLLGAAVSARHRSELQLRQQQAEISRIARVTAAGALGTTIVHQISQPLAAVATYAHTCRLLLQSEPGDQALLLKTLEKVEEEALRAGEIMERLREFVTKGSTRSVPVNLATLARGVVMALADEARSYGVGIQIHAPAEIPVAADRVEVEQVFVNLIRNAIEAAAEGGRAKKQVWIRLHEAAGEVRVAVEDSGPGVPPDIAEHLFEPFVSTKAKGLGLGLPLSREIVRHLGGDLWCDRMTQSGTCFSFRLPATKSNADA